MFLLRNNSKLCKYVVCELQFGHSNFYTKNAPKLAILSSKIETPSPLQHYIRDCHSHTLKEHTQGAHLPFIGR